MTLFPAACFPFAVFNLSSTQISQLERMDPALAYQSMVQSDDLSSLESSAAGVKSLIESLGYNSGWYTAILNAAIETGGAEAVSLSLLTQPSWVGASSPVASALTASVTTAYATVLDSVQIHATAAIGLANTAQASAAAASPELTLADDLVASATVLQTALGELAANQTTLALQDFAAVATAANADLASAQTLLASLQADPAPDAARIAVTQDVIAAAQALLTVAAEGVTTANTALARVAGTSPDSYLLTAGNPPQTYLSVWGNSGTVSLTDASGIGILIAPDGRVDTVPPSGSGWQFLTDSTFVLPDGAKISVTPGVPASVLATRGEQQLVIDNLVPGTTPSVTLAAAGGLAADAARNDGYILNMGVNATAWTLLGAPLGATPGTRETVAITTSSNELLIDVTTLPISSSMVQTLQAAGIDVTAFDTNQDGRLGAQEWASLANSIDGQISTVQSAFDEALAALKARVKPLPLLNTLLDESVKDFNREMPKAEADTATQHRVGKQLEIAGEAEARQGHHWQELEQALSHGQTPSTAASTRKFARSARILSGFASPVSPPQLAAAKAEKVDPSAAVAAPAVAPSRPPLTDNPTPVTSARSSAAQPPAPASLSPAFQSGPAVPVSSAATGSPASPAAASLFTPSGAEPAQPAPSAFPGPISPVADALSPSVNSPAASPANAPALAPGAPTLAPIATAPAAAPSQNPAEPSLPLETPPSQPQSSGPNPQILAPLAAIGTPPPATAATGPLPAAIPANPSVPAAVSALAPVAPAPSSTAPSSPEATTQSTRSVPVTPATPSLSETAPAPLPVAPTSAAPNPALSAAPLPGAPTLAPIATAPAAAPSQNPAEPSLPLETPPSQPQSSGPNPQILAPLAAIGTPPPATAATGPLPAAIPANPSVPAAVSALAPVAPAPSTTAPSSPEATTQSTRSVPATPAASSLTEIAPLTAGPTSAAPNPVPLRGAAPAQSAPPAASSQSPAAPPPQPTSPANPADAPATVLSTTEFGTVDPVASRRASILDDPTSLVVGPNTRSSLTDRISDYQARVQKAQEAKAEMIQQSQDLFQLIAGDQDLHAVFATDDTFAAVRDEAQANSQNLDDALGLGSDPVKTTEGQTKNLMKFLAAGSLRL